MEYISKKVAAYGQFVLVYSFIRSLINQLIYLLMHSFPPTYIHLYFIHLCIHSFNQSSINTDNAFICQLIKSIIN